VDYRDPLAQAHERIARLEEELAASRAKDAPPAHGSPDVPLAAPPRGRPSRLAFWSLPLALAAAIPVAVHRLPFESSFDPADVPNVRLVLVAAVAAFLLFAVEALVRARAGRATMASRLILAIACALVLPLALFALPAVGTVMGVSVAVGFAVYASIRLVRWISKGS
jgi:hypothetical protein